MNDKYTTYSQSKSLVKLGLSYFTASDCWITSGPYEDRKVHYFPGTGRACKGYTDMLPRWTFSDLMNLLPEGSSVSKISDPDPENHHPIWEAKFGYVKETEFGLVYEFQRYHSINKMRCLTNLIKWLVKHEFINLKN